MRKHSQLLSVLKMLTSKYSWLKDLADPKNFVSPIKIDGENKEQLKSDLKMMLLIRLAEEKIGDMLEAGKIKCPCHLAIGQEAIPVAIARHLRKSDRVFGTHRSHGHYLSTGGSVHGLFAEILGKATGCSKGMGGSMHLYDKANGFLGSVPIVAATVSLGVGAALAAQKDKKSNWDIAVSYFGDGAAEEGSVHESMNFSSKFRLPMLFVCENNLFSSHLHILLRQPADGVARYADSHGLNVEVVDGNDLVSVAQAADRLIKKARNGEGAGFLEVITYRWRGHVGPKEDIDVGLKRGDELIHWKKRDPVSRLATSMIEKKMITESELEKTKSELKSLMSELWLQAERDPFPNKEALMDLVYKTPHGATL